MSNHHQLTRNLSVSYNQVMNELGYPGAVRLKMTVDWKSILAEAMSIDAEKWNQQGRMITTHGHVNSVFLRGFAPLEGGKPIQDRKILSSMSQTKLLLHEQLPGKPARAVLADLKPGGTVPLHTDQADVFKGIVRIHVPLRTNSSVISFFGDHFYEMKPGEVWAVNNLMTHAIANQGNEPRLHIITDRIVSEEVLTALSTGNANLGVRDDLRKEKVLAMSEKMREETKFWRPVESLTRRIKQVIFGNASQARIQ